MVKKVKYKGTFLSEYKKDIKGASELLNRLPKNEKLKKSMAHALLNCLHEDVSYDYDDEIGGDFLAHYLFKIENKFSEDKRPLVWLCGYLSFKLISYNNNNIRPVIISEEVVSSDLSDLIGPENYKSIFVDSSISESKFLNKIIELSERQLKGGWGFSECLGQSVERNICIEIGEKDEYKEDSKFFFLDCDYDKNYPNFLPPGSHIVLDTADFVKEEVDYFWFEASLFKLILLLPITEDFSNINIFSNSVGNIMLETLSKFSAQNLLVSNDSDLISCLKCGEIPLYPELRELVPNYPSDAYLEHLYKNI